VTTTLPAPPDQTRQETALSTRIAAPASPPPTPASRWQLMRTRLRKRVRWALLAGLIGGAAGAVLGWNADTPTYRAELRLEVRPVVAGVSSEATEGDPAEAVYRAFVERQIELLQTHASGKGELTVTAGTGRPTPLHLALLHTKRNAAADTLASLLEAYQRSAEFERQQADAAQLEKLIEDRTTLRQHLLAVRQQRNKVETTLGSLQLDEALRTRAEELAKIELQLTETEIALATLKAQSAEPTSADTQRLAAMARTDSVLAGLLARQAELAARYDAMSLTMGENAPAMRELRTEIDAVAQQINRHVTQATAARVNLAGLGIEGAVTLTVDELAGRQRTLSQMRDRVAAEHARLVEHKRQIQQLDDAIAYAQSLIEQREQQMRQLLVGGWAAGRVLLPESLTPLVTRHADPRPAAALLGGTAGGLTLLAIALVLLAADQRILRAEIVPVATGAAPLLGRVPAMDKKGDGSIQSQAAAMSIHEIRALLELRGAAAGAKAFAITSPSEGSGKTSLTVGLATSLALSGTRTLLVDCELTGRAKPAANNGVNGAPQRQSVDEVMTVMGYLDDRETDILLLPPDAKVGLVGMLEGGTLEQCVVETSVPNLSLLPAVGARPQHVGRLSTHFISELIAEARRHYDMILFDTGPIPGSIEALFVAGRVDEVILVVARGETQSRVDKTLAQLRMIGAKLAGTVFNRDEMQLAGAAGESTTDTPIARQDVGSGIFAAAVQAQTAAKRSATAPSRKAEVSSEESPATEPASPVAPAPTTVQDEDDDAIRPEDAGELYRTLLAEEIDLDARQSPGAELSLNEAATPDSITSEPPTSAGVMTADAAPTADNADELDEDDMLDNLVDSVIVSAHRAQIETSRQE